MFGTRLKELREEKGLTQEELGKKLNLSKANISKYESGMIEPNLQILKFLADFFDVSSDFLLGRTNIPNLQLHNSLEKTDTTKNPLDLIYNALSPEEQKELVNYAKYLKTKSLLDGSNKESSAISEGK